MPNDKPKNEKYISSNGKERYGKVYSYTMNRANTDWMKNVSKPIRITMEKADIPKFLSMLHETQFNLIEAAVESRERQGFPEANEVIKRIMEKK